MTGQKGLFTFLTTHKTLTRKQRAALVSAQPSELPSLAESMGMKVTTDIDIRSRERRVESLLAQMLEEQRKTSQMLLLLIEAMGEEDSDPDDEPVTYMDGTPVVGGQ